jgi:CxxC motif-containing protein (DUF1111 family)
MRSRPYAEEQKIEVCYDYYCGPRIAAGSTGPGLGQRIFFLHDGRTSDLVQAIQAHGSNGNRQYQNSEANGVVNSYNKLSSGDQQDLLNFLRSS